MEKEFLDKLKTRCDSLGNEWRNNYDRRNYKENPRKDR